MKSAQRMRLWLIGAGLIFCCFGLMWGLPHIFDFAQDSVVPMGVLAEKDFAFEEVTAFRYPPFHFWVLRAVFLPARAIIALASPNEKVRSTLFILSARLVSVAMAIGALMWLFATARRLWDERAGLAAGLLMLFSPLTLYYAKNANLDVPYIFWLVGALYFYVRIMQDNRRKDYLWLGLTAALAVCTKDQAYGFILLMPVGIAVRLWANGGEERRFQNCAVGAGVFLGVYLLVNLIGFGPAKFVEHLRVIVGPGSEGWRLFRPDAVGQLRLLVETALRLLDAWTAAGVALVAFGIAAAFRQRENRWLYAALLLPVIGYYLGFLAVVGYVPTRFVLPMMLPLALLGGRGVVWMWERRGGWRTGAVILLAWVALAGLSLDWVMANNPRYDAQMWMIERVPPTARIYYVGEARDMPRLNAPFDPRQLAATPEAVEKARATADMLILSIPQGEPGGVQTRRLSSLIRSRLGNWGLTTSAIKPAGPAFLEELMSGKMGFVEVARFQSPISPWVPEVAESVNRRIVFMVND